MNLIYEEFDFKLYCIHIKNYKAVVKGDVITLGHGKMATACQL